MSLKLILNDFEVNDNQIVCSCSQDEVDFGTIAVGMRETRSLVLRNSGRASTLFRVINVADDCVIVEPTRAVVSAGDATTIHVSVKANRVTTIGGFVLVLVLGGDTRT